MELLPVTGIGEIRPGDDLAQVLAYALAPAPDGTGLEGGREHGAGRQRDRTQDRGAGRDHGSAGHGDRVALRDGDVLVVTQKVVSKAEGRLVPVDQSDPAAKVRLVESESVRVLRRRGTLLVTETRHGFVCANAGVDLSNVEAGTAALLPVDSDRSARRLRTRLGRLLGVDVAVVISDTFGRPWRRGVTDVAIGCAGVAAVLDLRGTTDAGGRELVATEVCVADELASAAELVMGKSRGVPAAVVRGVPAAWLVDGSVRRDVVRPPAEDLFR